MDYRAILFDADSMTILSPRFSERVQKEYGITWETMKPFFQGPFNECKIGKDDLKVELAKVVEAWGWKGTVDELMDFWFKDDVVNEEIVQIVQKLRKDGVRCYLATNQEKYRAEYLRNTLRLGDVFDDLLVSADLGHLKNDPQYFEKVVAALNLDREQTLFVDHEEANIEAAKKAGLATYMFHDMQAFKEFLI